MQYPMIESFGRKKKQMAEKKKQMTDSTSCVLDAVPNDRVFKMAECCIGLPVPWLYPLPVLLSMIVDILHVVA